MNLVRYLKIRTNNIAFLKITGFGILIILGTLITGCKKLVEVDAPITNVNSANIYNNDATAASVLTGIYTNLSRDELVRGGLTGISLYAGVSSDEFEIISQTQSSQNLRAYYLNNLNAQNAGVEFWNAIYSNLYVINAALEGVTNSTTLTPAVKQQILGEAKFMRAFYFFYLVNLYGDVPLVLSTNYKTNALMSRTPKVQVWQQIVTDLKEAQNLLSSEYLDASLLKQTTERVRPTKGAATALLARAYLYTKDWVNAEIQATSILKSSHNTLVQLSDVFKKNNDEAIWQLQPVDKGQNTKEASTFIIIYDTDFDKPKLSKWLLNSFEAGDQRQTQWVNSIVFNDVHYFYNYKYKAINLTGDLDFPVVEYSTILRLGEQYLIRAEARIQQQKIPEGINDLNILRDRATDKVGGAVKLSMLRTSLTQKEALDAVLHERQIELFGEWGHRWLDLKRTEQVDNVMGTVLPEKINNGIWKSYLQLYPIPIYDIQKNPNLLQNQGY